MNNNSCDNCRYYLDTCSGVYNVPDYVCDRWAEKAVRIESMCETCRHADHHVYHEAGSEATQEWDECTAETCNYEKREDE